jgi:hypothetical protein
VLIVVEPAQAADTCSQPTEAVTWDTPALEVEYGDFWYTSARGSGMQQIDPWEGTGSISGAPSGYKPVTSFYTSGSDQCGLILNISGNDTWLPPGGYTLKAHFDLGGGENIDTTLPLKITPAALTLTARITADATNPRNAIVTASMGGDFIKRFRDYWGSTSTDGAPGTPEGTWKVAVTDASGTPVTDFSSDRSAKSDAWGASWIWLDAPAGEYTAKATFTPSGASATDFTVTPSADFDFTAPGPAAGDQPTASPAPSAPAAVADSGPTLPAWIPLTAGVVSAGLLELSML